MCHILIHLKKNDILIIFKTNFFFLFFINKKLFKISEIYIIITDYNDYYLQ